MDFKELVEKEEYDFLRTNEHLGDNIMLLTLGGSHAYGTNTPTSDVDIRGITLERERELLGLSNFEQFINKETDTTIYGLRKIVSLLMNCNPNTIELLGTKNDQIIQISESGRLLRDNAGLFLSKKAFHSFGGYASAQLRRLQNSLARDNYPQPEKEKHILGSIKHQMHHLQRHYTPFADEDIKVYVDKSDKVDFETEIFVDINMKHYPLRDFKNIHSDMSQIIKTYSSLNHRNNKKDDLHLNKHAMHLVRLLAMGAEILEGKGVSTYRENDLDLLMSIRNGKYQKEDGSFDSSFFEMVSDYEKKLKYANEHSELPKKPDYNKIEELVIEISKKNIVRG